MKRRDEVISHLQHAKALCGIIADQMIAKQAQVENDIKMAVQVISGDWIDQPQPPGKKYDVPVKDGGRIDTACLQRLHAIMCTCDMYLYRLQVPSIEEVVASWDVLIEAEDYYQKVPNLLGAIMWRLETRQHLKR